MHNQNKDNLNSLEKYTIFFVFHKIEEIPFEFDSISKKDFSKFIQSIKLFKGE